MTVRELIEELKKQDLDMEVLVDGYEEGYDPIGHIFCKNIKPHSDPVWYYGRYEEAYSDNLRDNTRKALIISRN